MSEFISNIVGKQLGGDMPGADKQQLQQTQKSQSFENILQKTDGQTGGATGQTGSITNDPKMQELRGDLMNRYQNLPDGVPKKTAILPEFMDTKTNMNSFRDMLGQAVGSLPQGKDVQGKFTNVENEWMQIEGIMKSDKDMSQGELLGLQARLYQVSQHIDVLSKVVDQMTGGIKTVLNTNV